jgi:glycerol-3-phosphate acyltransferase PlsX
MLIKISIDASGGDKGIPVTVSAGIKALTMFSDLYLYFVGNESEINNELKKHPNSKDLIDRFSIVNADEVIKMNELPTDVLRKNKKTSMREAINLVKNKQADACVSSGNTGALMVISRSLLKTIKGIDRPAIMAIIPTVKGSVNMLDLGANVDSKEISLFQFAIMGSVVVKHTKNIKNPRVSLLNIGKEETKGNYFIKQTSELLKKSNLNYTGFIEGDDVYKGKADLVVCDGFEGNIFLKASEGVVLMMVHHLKQAFNRNIFSKIIGILSKSILKNFKHNIDPKKYNGASLLGLRGIVIKSHGSADSESFLYAIKEAYIEANAKIIDKISKQIEDELANQL